MLTPIYSTKFLKDLKRCVKRGLEVQKLVAVIDDLQNEIPLDPKHKVHPLQGEYKGYLECHIGPDWLLIYLVDRLNGEIYFIRTGTHADLF